MRAKEVWLKEKWDTWKLRRKNRELLQNGPLIEEIAYHEAGHAVVACLVGFEISHVTILYDPVYHKPGVALIKSEQVNLRLSRDKNFNLAFSERQIAQSMAGRLTAERKTGKCNFSGSETDIFFEVDLAQSLGLYHSLDIIKKNTSCLIAEPEVWATIINVVNALYAKHRLSGDEVCSIVAECQHELYSLSGYFQLPMSEVFN